MKLEQREGAAMKVLLVDEDCDTGEMLTPWLKNRGYEVLHALRGERAKHLWMEHRPDLVIMDVSLRDVNALALLRDLRTKHDALVLAVSESPDVKKEIQCLDSGADAYLRKPFFPAQLLAHINSLTRRARTTLDLRPSSILTVGPFQIEALRNQVVVGDKPVTLTPTESKILHLLAANANNVCTLGQIVSHVWGYANSGDTYLVKAHIRHLREKLEQDPGRPQYLTTITGVGYSLRRAPADGHVAAASAEAEAAELLAELSLTSRQPGQDVRVPVLVNPDQRRRLA